MDSVVLSSKTAGVLGELDMLPAERLSALCKFFMQSVITGTSKIAIEDREEAILRAISTLLLEAAKARAEASVVAAILTENGVATHASAILELYQQHKDTLIEHIEATGIAAPSIVGIDWRLDYSVRSKHGGRENVPMFFVNLHVIDRGVLRDIDMIASQEEMKDLLSRVKEAVRSVQKVVHAVQDEDE